jgi:antitoxin VapB
MIIEKLLTIGNALLLQLKQSNLMHTRGKLMNIIKLSNENEHQFVDSPQSYQIAGDEAYIKKVGNVILLIPKDKPSQALLSSLDLSGINIDIFIKIHDCNLSFKCTQG